MDKPMTEAIVCFYRGRNFIDLAIRAYCRRPGQAVSDVPSHVSLILPSASNAQGTAGGVLYEYISTGWHKRGDEPADYAWAYHVPLPDMAAAITQAKTDKGRYRWWVDGAIGLARFIPNRWYLRWPKLTHLAYRHICSLFAIEVLREGGWACPDWMQRQDCPASPCDLLFAVRETSKQA